MVEFLKIPVVNEPGTEFLYSSALSFMLSAIVTRTTGEAVRDYLEPRMFAPLGITGLTWGASPNGISSGGNGLTWKTADSLKLGILHLDKGQVERPPGAATKLGRGGDTVAGTARTLRLPLVGE